MTEQERPDALALLRAAQQAADAYQEACARLGYGYRVADEDARVLDALEERAGRGELTCGVPEALTRVLEDRLDVSPYDDSGYIYQGVLDDISDGLERLGLTREGT